MSRSLNPYLLTLPQLLSAKKKIAHVAAFYDPSGTTLRGFDAEALDATQFREQLRRNFMIKLTDDELGAIVFLFDKDGDGKVDSVEFVNEFLKLGKIEKERLAILNKEECEKRMIKHQNRLKKNEERFSKLAEIKVSMKWSDQDEKTAIKKMAKVAFSYDREKGGLEVRYTYICVFYSHSETI